MNYSNNSNNNIKNEELCVKDMDPLLQNIDIDELTAGINRSLNDIRHGRVYDLDTAMRIVRKRVFGE